MRLGRGPSASERSDAAYVAEQLRDAVDASVVRWKQAHDFGSTVAIERGCEVDLRRPCVAIHVETETIPVDITAACLRDDVAFRVRFFDPQVERGKATYHAQLLS